MASGRPQKDIDLEVAMDMLMDCQNMTDVAKTCGVSVPTLRKRINHLQSTQGILLEYRALQSLQLTELQARILDAITPEKIDDADLKDLVLAYKILKEKELVIEGKPSDIKGLMAHLIYLEKKDVAGEPVHKGNGEDVVDINLSLQEQPNDLAQLSELDNEEF